MPLSPTGVGGAIVLVEMAGRKLAYVADEDERAVRTVDLASRTELAVTPDGARLLVTSRWGHALTVYETGTLKAAFTVDLPRDPLAVVISSDGARAFVSHVTGARLSVVDLQEHGARQIDLRQVERPLALVEKPVRWSTGQGYTLARSTEGRIFAPEILANPNPTPGEATAGYGPGGSPSQIGDIAALDEAGEHLATTPVLDFRDHADCLLPRAAAIDEASGRLLVACLGVDAIIAYDARAKNPHLAPTRRWKVASGPTGIAVDSAERRAVVWSQFAHTVSLISLDAASLQPRPTVGLRLLATNITPHYQTEASFTLPSHAAPMDVTLALGRRLFHASGDAKIAGDGRARVTAIDSSCSSDCVRTTAMDQTSAADWLTPVDAFSRPCACSSRRASRPRSPAYRSGYSAPRRPRLRPARWSPSAAVVASYLQHGKGRRRPDCLPSSHPLPSRDQPFELGIVFLLVVLEGRVAPVRVVLAHHVEAHPHDRDDDAQEDVQARIHRPSVSEPARRRGRDPALGDAPFPSGPRNA